MFNLFSKQEMQQTIMIRTDINMGKGKMVAQGCHASLLAYINAQQRFSDWVRAWMDQGMKKVVVKVDERLLIQTIQDAKTEVPYALIRDAGYTQVAPNTITAGAIGPGPKTIIDKYTGRFKLL